MRKGINLNEYEEVALKDVLRHVIDTELNSFCTLCKNAGLTMTPGMAGNINELLYTLPHSVKDHVYYKALFLNNELVRLENE